MGTVAANLGIILQSSKCFAIILFLGTLYIYLYPIHFKDADITKLPDLVRVQQLHSSCAFVEVVPERDAAAPVLDFAVASPYADVDGFGRVEDFSEAEM